MKNKGFIYLDLFCALIITSIFIPILVSSVLQLSHLHHYLTSVSGHLLLIKNNINSINSSTSYEPKGTFLTQFHLFKESSYSTPIVWIHKL
jgi:hypothetical protein